MTRVLLVEDDEAFRRSLKRILAEAGYDVTDAGTVDLAQSLVDEQAPFDVVLTDLKVGEGNGIDLIAHLAKHSARARPVLMSAFATSRDHQLATDLGAVKVLQKPFEPKTLLSAIKHAVDCDDGFRGSFHGLSLVDVLQLFHMNRRSVTIEVGVGGGGAIHMRNGDIVHAKIGPNEGEHALTEILSAKSGAVRTAAAPSTFPETIERPFDNLLLDVLRQVDEQEYGTQVAGDESLGLELEFAIQSSLPPPMASARRSILPQQVDNKGELITMGKIDDSCKNVVDEVDGGVACGVIDLDTGMILGIHNSASYTQTLNEVVAAAAVDMFRGSNVSRIEKMVRKHRGEDENGSHYFEEIHVSSAHNYHFMKTLRGGKAVIVLVTKKSTNIGMGWAMLKSVLPEVEPHIP